MALEKVILGGQRLLMDTETGELVVKVSGRGFAISRVHGTKAAGETQVLVAGSAGKKTAIFAIELELAAGASFTITEETTGTVLYSGALSKTFDASGISGVPFILAPTAGKDLILTATGGNVTYTAVVGVEE